MTPPLRHTRILASAGSGKTFQLSGRYIELLRREPGADPAGILASTFTRAAAAEIRDRILARLARATFDPQEREELAEASGLPVPSEEEATALLERTARRIDRLQIRTLDSFFAASAAAFARELGLPGEPRVANEVELERLKADAVDRMLAIGDSEGLLRTVAALNRGRPRLSIAGAIMRAVWPAMEVFRDSAPEAWAWHAPEAASDEDVRRMIEALAGLPEAPDARLVKARDALATALRSIEPEDVEGWSELLGRGLFKAALEGVYYRKPLPDAYVAATLPLIEHARSLALREAVRRTTAVHELAASFLEAWTAVKEEAGFVTFDDIARAMGDAGTQPDLSELFLRLDATLRHALLDEFQDTSVLQWRALLPLLREFAAGSAEERSLFLVGDLKQSIYGWRGAAPALLDQAPALLLESGRADFEDEPLHRSFRSSRVVLEGVDLLFGSIDKLPQVCGDETLRSAALAWKEAWHAHEAARSHGGVVELHVAERIDSRSRSLAQQEAALILAADLTAELRERHPTATIGVLCRRKRAQASILQFLRERSVAADAAGIGSLQDAAPVNAILDALVLADHPDHTIAAFHIGHTPLGRALEFGPADHRDKVRRRALSRRLRNDLDRRGYAETIRRWRDAILSSVDAREAERLEELVAAAARFDRPDAPAERPARVAAALRILSIDEVGASGTTVMNLHQSKGLEFDLVVLCDLDQPFRDHDSLAAIRDRPDGPYTRVIRWVSKEARSPELEPIFARVRADAFREHLSLLYVGLTRAKSGLFAVVGPPPKKEESITFAGLLREAWAPGRTEPGAFVVAGDRATLVAASASEAPAKRHLPDRITLAPAGGRRIGRAVSASQALPRAASGEFSPRARERGSALHAMLETIEWIEEGLPSADALLRAGRSASPRLAREELEALAAEVIERLRTPAIAEVFARPEGDVRLLREARFARLIRSPEGARIEEGAIDRLLLFGPPGQPTGARIIDFKSGRSLDESAAGERYRPQLEAYRRAVAERYGPPQERIEALLVLFERGVVVRT